MGYLLQHFLTASSMRRPTGAAARMDGVAMSYETLERSTNQLARALRGLGVQKGDRVGLYVPKSFGSVVGVFGIMKAGACYVPLDPHAPTKRTAFIMRDCGIKVVFAAASTLPLLREIAAEGYRLDAVVLAHDVSESELGESLGGTDVRVVRPASVQAEDDADLVTSLIDTDLAYILYTSGSTGSPKGVMISHRTILTFTNWSHETFRLTADDRITSHAPLHFDLSTFDIYATVKAGGTIVLLNEHLSTLPEQLAKLIDVERVTVTYLVPSILSLLVRYGNLGRRDMSSLRLVLFAGEVFPIKYLRQLVSAIPHAQFYNLYGPTETNVCTYYQLRPEDVAPERTQPVPIGRACGNIDVFALSDSGERVTEPGVEGELWVRGSCVAEGYWGDAEKTARGFVQNPLNGVWRDVAYRTGDIVTLGADRENWNFMGRRDHMIKSRGYRIEIGEIESAFYRHEAVREAAVIAIPDDLLGSRLRAFVVPTEGRTVTVSELSSFCSQLLPKYMVPEAIELCEGIPKTSSGKTDRPALMERLKPRTDLRAESSSMVAERR
jgi:amino acid adenylation domain-containing protein